jgi:hypothetical protein
MKAVATAVVLTAAGAVILWSGVTLNSWVLGGLIGGLAALLIAVPIALVLFFHLSKQHNAFFGEAMGRKKVSFSQVYDYPTGYLDELDGNEREVEGSLYTLEQGYYASEEDLDLQYPDYDYDDGRSLSAYHRAAPRANNQPVKRLPAPERRSTNGLQTSKRVSEPASSRGKSIQGERRSGRATPSGSALSQYRSQALRAARQEAVRRRSEIIRREEENTEPEDLPVSSRRPFDEPEQDYRPRIRRASRSLSTQTNPRRHQREMMEEDLLMQETDLEAEDMDEFDNMVTNRHYPRSTGYHPRHAYPYTEPVERIAPSGRAQRHLRQPEDSFDTDVTTEADVTTGRTTDNNIQRPLIRRAPYLYDDDPLRQELSPYFDRPPVTRRTSRLDRLHRDGR